MATSMATLMVLCFGFGVIISLDFVFAQVPNPNNLIYGNQEVEPINIFIIPHSHTDPGWLETLEVYYEHQVHEILQNIFYELRASRTKKFAWAEICYLRRFYDELGYKE